MALLSFSKRFLQPPRRGGIRHNLTAIIRNRLNSDENALEPFVRRKQRNADEASVMVAAVSSKIEDRNIKTAIRILTSDDKSAQTRRKPCQTSRTNTRNLPRTPICGRTTTNTNLYKSRKLTSFRQSDPSRRVHRAVRMGCAHNTFWSLRRAKKLAHTWSYHNTAFTNLLLEGKFHDEWAPIIFGRSLIALTKKSEGFAPLPLATHGED